MKSTRINGAANNSGRMLLAIFAFACLTLAPFDCTRVYGLENWVRENLSKSEICEVEQLAKQIAGVNKLPTDAPAKLRDAVEDLSIREAAALGVTLLDQHQFDPRPWLALPHARELKAKARLQELQRRLGHKESGYRYIETAIRGPKRLRKLCGEETLTEIIGAGFWSFADDIPISAEIEDDDVEIIVALPGLEWVTAYYTNLTDRGVLRLAALPRLRELRIPGADIGNISLTEIGKHHDLRVLDVSHANRVDDAGIAALRNCKSVNFLNLHSTSVTSKCLPVIAGMVHLKMLSLSETRIRDGLSQLRVLNALRELRLSNLANSESPLPARELEFISSLKELQILKLKNTATRRLALINLPNLRFLSLGHATLKDLSLIDLPEIKTLRLGTDFGKPALEFASLQICDLGELRSLSIQGLTPRAAAELARGIPTMPKIYSLTLQADMTNTLAMAIGGMPMLERINFQKVTNKQLAAIARAPKLADVQMSGKSVTSKGLAALGRAPKLLQVQIEDLVIEDAGFLKALKSLETLRMDRCRIGTLTIDETIAVTALDIRQGAIGELTVKGSQRLRQLSTSYSEIGQLAIDSCPSFSHMFCGSDSKFDRVQLKNLPALPSITFQEGTSPGTLVLKQLPKLRDVEFWAAKIDKQHIEALASLPALEELDISATPIGDEAAAAVAKLKTLKSLSASFHFSTKGLKLLTRLPSLHQLNLYHGEHSDWTPEQARQLFTDVEDVAIF